MKLYACKPAAAILAVLVSGAAVWSSAAAFEGPLVAGGQAGSRGVGSSEGGEDIAGLIDQLGSPSFAERQRATARLLELGEPALEALTRIPKDSPADVQRRVGLIVGQLQQRIFDERLAQVRETPTVEAAATLPEWDRFRVLTSVDDENAAQRVEVFAQIEAAEPELFRARLFQPESLSGLLERRSAQLSVEFDDKPEESFPVASWAALVLLGSDPQTRLPRATSSHITSALEDGRLAQLVDDGAERDVLRGLLSAWFERPDINAEKPLLFTMQHGIAGGVRRAERVIETRSRRPEMILAVLTLGKVGSPDTSVPLLESLLDDPTVLWPFGGRIAVAGIRNDVPPDSRYQVQTRDVALAVACHLRGVHPREIGMKVRDSRTFLFAVDSLGFHSDDDRAAALASYRSRYPVTPR